MPATPLRPPSRPILAADPGRALAASAALPEASAVSADVAIDNFFALIRRQLGAPLRETVVLAERLEGLRQTGHLPESLAAREDFRRLAETSRQLTGMVERLLSIGDVLGRDALPADERVLLADVAGLAAAALSSTATDRNVGIALDVGKENLAPIYGSVRWLTQAFVDLLAPLVHAAPAGSHVVVQLRQVGYHQLVSGQMGGLRPPAGSVDLLSRARNSVQADIAAATGTATLDRALARAIVELHGGSLRREVLDDGEEQFTLSLPTGELAPGRHNDCTDCPYARQSELFARDLAELLNAQSGAAAPLHGTAS